jgi:hypothetical protein
MDLSAGAEHSKNTASEVAQLKLNVGWMVFALIGEGAAH